MHDFKHVGCGGYPTCNKSGWFVWGAKTVGDAEEVMRQFLYNNVPLIGSDEWSFGVSGYCNKHRLEWYYATLTPLSQLAIKLEGARTK